MPDDGRHHYWIQPTDLKGDASASLNEPPILDRPTVRREALRRARESGHSMDIMWSPARGGTLQVLETIEPPDEGGEPSQDAAPEGSNVFWEHPVPIPTGTVEAELPSSERVPAVRQRDGRRLGFGVALPKGTAIWWNGRIAWVL